MQFLSNIDLTKSQLQNAVAHFLAAAPASPSEGQFYYNSVSKYLGFYNGTAWIILGRLDQMVAGADVSLSSFKLTNLAAPTAGTDAATKAYVDGLIAGLGWKDEVRAATTANGALATAFANGQVVDAVTLATNDRILIKNQTTGSENGIYVVAASGAPARATDADTALKIQQAAVFVMEGSANADTAWVMSTNAPITLGTTALTFVKFAGGAASGINKYSVDVGNGSLTSIAVTHNLGTLDVIVEVYNKTSGARVVPDITHTDVNTVTLVFATAPAAAAYRCTVVG